MAARDHDKQEGGSSGGGFFSSIASSISNFGTAMHKSVNGLLGYEGLEVINPEGGTEDAEEEAHRGRWKQEDRDSYWKMMQKYIGSDVTSMVSLPVLIFEPMTMIQKMAELMEYSHLLDLADECEDPYMRLVYATSWAISVYYAYQRTWKPFNPILGETYEMVNHGGITFIAEQVCHHPPMSAGHAENAHFTYDVTSKLKTKFLGNSLDIYPVGRTRVTLKRDGVVLDLVPPPTKANNLIFGRTWVDSLGEMIMTNLTTGDKAVLYFQPCGWFGNGRYEVDGYVYNAAEEPKILITGKWNESMSYQLCDMEGEPLSGTELKEVWRVAALPENDKFQYTYFARKINSFDTAPKKLLASDSRLRPDRYALEKSDLSKAGAEKSSLEERQRAEKRDREAKGHQFTPRWFDLSGEVTLTPWGELEVYQYNGKYTEHRATIDALDTIDEVDIKSIEFNPWQYGNISVQPETKESVETTSVDFPVSGDAIRRRFLEFYSSRGHKVLPSASLVPDDPTVLLTIAGMLQFKPIFLGKAPRSVARATTAQRCIRTNDVENVGQTTRHHTFFEMLGNFSFGDYFKREAINWAWELTTKEFGLSPKRLWISVFKDDDEAFSIWHDEVGVPVERIKRMGEEDNFWSSGLTGPCGPCSEIYYDFHPERGYMNADLGDDSRFIEFYNLVFMQYNKKGDGSIELLKQKNIDTGLGLERMARILQKVPNNYETDLIYPIIEKASTLAGVSYADADDDIKTKLKIIGDHMRAVVYLISDGVLPSNIGRGYVVRRLIRRVVRTGRLLGMKGYGEGNLEGAFLSTLAETVIELSTRIDVEVKARSLRILEELKREELRFVQTLERGEKLLEEFLTDALLSAKKNGSRPCLSGKDAFLLYDTYGFPIEITSEVAEERGVSIDMKDFDVEMENQRRQSQAAHNVVKLSVGSASELTKSVPDTEFLGYDTLSATATVKGLLVNGDPVVQVSKGSEVEILLNRTPFYAESGGQVGDHGYLYVLESEEDKGKAIVEVKDVKKSLGNIFVHMGTIREGTIEVGTEVDAAVDANLRQRAKVHHTATHLLQAALKSVLGQETSQAGSLVAFDRLRFDFNFHRPLQEHEMMEIEGLVNKWIGDATHLQTKVMPLTDAKRARAIAMFGEKYGEEVRVVEVPGVSMELCGGTHVSSTSELRGFKIISEQGIASGIRRIEAVAGEAFIDYINVRDNHMKHLCSTLKVKAEDVTGRVESLLEELRTVRSEVSVLRTKAAVYKASMVASKAFPIGTSKIRVLVENMDDMDADSLKSAAEYLVESLQDPAAVVLGSCPGEGKVSLVASFTPGIVDMGIQAGKFIGGIARMCGGGGGGRPNFAQAGGRKPKNLSNALDKARTDLVTALSEKTS